MLASWESRMASCCRKHLEQAKEQLLRRTSAGVFQFPERLLEPRAQNLDQLFARMERCIAYQLEAAREGLNIRTEQLPKAWSQAFGQHRKRLEMCAARLDAMSPLKVLSRGYSITERQGRPIRFAQELAPGDPITVRFSEGAVLARVEQNLEEN